MALRIPWDIEEAVLMLDMLLKSIDGKLTRKEAIRQVSEKLRRRAINRGITIDDIFRNENGSHSRCRLWKLPIPEEKQN